MTAIHMEKVYAKFRDIRESIERLRRFSATPRAEFLKDRDSQDIAGFRLIVATEAAIDACLHVAARTLNQVPEEYAGCFKLLGEHHLIDQEVASRLAAMARFRNLLVHRYWEIDYGRMYDIITGDDLADLEIFMKQIGRLFDAET